MLHKLLEMKKFIALHFALILGMNTLDAQSPGNSLHFDGTNDYVIAALPTVFNDIPNNDFTIEAWIKPGGNIFSRIVYAQLSTTSFATVTVSNSNQIYFYVSNLTSAVTTATLPLGVWSHVACTWDASTSGQQIYINGVLQTTNGGGSSSTGTDNTMTIGARTNAAQFFPGELDEVRIWDDIRTQCEISGSMNSEFTVAQPNLVAYYNFNVGVAGGTNTGLNNLPDFTMNYSGTLTNFLLDGATSNWLLSAANINAVNQTTSITGTDVQTACGSLTWLDGNTYMSNNNTATFNYPGGASNGCDSLVTLNLTILNTSAGTDTRTECVSYTWIDGNTYTSSNNSATYTFAGGASNGCDSIVTLDLTIANPTTGTDTQTACGSYTWIDGNTYTSSNNSATYTLVGGNANGCDSIVTLDLTINSVSDLTTNVSGITIQANNGSASSYAWLDCGNNYAAILGATNQSFTPSANGNYAVALTENGCVDTSACVAITTIGILENDFAQEITLYPNPNSGNCTVDLGAVYQNIYFDITDLNGRMLLSAHHDQGQLLQISMDYPAGVYLLNIRSGGNTATLRVLKE